MIPSALGSRAPSQTLACCMCGATPLEGGAGRGDAAGAQQQRGRRCAASVLTHARLACGRAHERLLGVEEVGGLPFRASGPSGACSTRRSSPSIGAAWRRRTEFESDCYAAAQRVSTCLCGFAEKPLLARFAKVSKSVSVVQRGGEITSPSPNKVETLALGLARVAGGRSSMAGAKFDQAGLCTESMCSMLGL